MSPLTVIFALVASLPAGASGLAGAQLQLAPIAAVVVDAHDRPVSAARLTLTDPLGAELQRAVTDAQGRAVFAAVAPGRYALVTAAPGAVPFALPISIRGGLPVELTVRVPAAVTDAVTVEGRQGAEPSSRGSIAGTSLALVPVRVQSRALQDVVATLPGWSTEDNGLIHARGVDDGFLYVIDGVPVYERLDAVSGLAPDLSSVAAVTVISGYVPPEFGHKAGGVIEIRSATSQASWTGHADLRLGSDGAIDGTTSLGGRLARGASVRAGLSSGRSQRFLDPVDPGNLHNDGGQVNTFGQLDWSASSRDRVNAGWGYGRALFDVPNNHEQEVAGQDQRQRLHQGFLNVSWQRTWSPTIVTHGAVYHRQTNAQLDGSRFDTPLEAHANRDLDRTGVLFGVTRQHTSHLIKVGLEWQRLLIDEGFQFAITDLRAAQEAGFRDEALVFRPDHPFRFAGRATPTLRSFYAQDSWDAVSGVTISGGVRYDRSELLLTRSQWSPRIGAAFRLAPGTVLRAAVSRFYQPPQPENLLLSSSPEARVLSAISVGEDAGGADVEPERQWATEVGIEHRLGSRARLDMAYWHRRIQHVGDPNVFAATTIIFPNAIAAGRAHGVEMRLEVPRHRGWSGYANWSAGRVIQTGPVTGGLFLEDEVEELGLGVEFIPDHDQRFTGGGGVTWQHVASGVIVSLAGRYETGTPIQQDENDVEELMERPGADLVDFDTGRVASRTVVSLVLAAPLLETERLDVTTGLHIVNLFDARYAYNFGNPFSGTHFGAPRSFAVTLRVTFR